MFLAVIIPVYLTTEEHLRNTAGALNSFRTAHPHRIFLLVNRSHGYEKELDAIRTLCGDDAHLIFNPEPKSVAATWNQGLALGLDAEADKFLVLNNDIVLKPNCPDRLLSFAGEHPEFILVSGQPYHEPATLASAPESEEWNLGADYSCFLTGPSLVEEVGPFDENFRPAYFEDMDMHRRIFMSGRRTASFGGARFYHHTARTTASDPDLRAAGNANFARNLAYYTRKWGGPPREEKFTRPFGG